MNHSTKDFPPLPPRRSSAAKMTSSMNPSTITNVMKGRNPEKPWSLTQLMDYTKFTEHFTYAKQLGAGGDGTVAAYSVRSRPNDLIAVKVPKDGSHRAKKAILSEIKSLRDLEHDNIAGMLAFCDNFKPASPAIFFEVCDLGDAFSYKVKWFAQQGQKKLGEIRLPEVTVLKFLHDVSLALDFLHNGRDVCHIHNDLKLENVLVMKPPGYKGSDLPTEPIFKLTDFSRSTSHPSASGRWSGTPEFAPPHEERKGVPKPSVDIWSLGASIQSLALNIIPIQSRVEFKQRMRKLGKPAPELNDKAAWVSGKWRDRLPVVYRPLDTTREDLMTNWDLANCWRYHRPYSTALNNWYRMLLDTDPVARITSAHLKKYVVPSLEKQMLIAKELALAESGFTRLRLQLQLSEVQKAGEHALRMETLD